MRNEKRGNAGNSADYRQQRQKDGERKSLQWGVREVPQQGESLYEDQSPRRSLSLSPREPSENRTSWLPLVGILLSVMLTGVIIFLAGSITGLVVLDMTSEGHFRNGTFNGTFYNVTAFAVELNFSGQLLLGNYTSNVSDAGASATWNNITFVPSAVGELAANSVNESALGTYGSGDMDMSSAELYYRFNNDTTVGENTTLVFDFSGPPYYNGTYEIDTGAQSNATAIGHNFGKFAGHFSGGAGDHLNVSSGFPVTWMNGTFMAWVRINAAVPASGVYRVASSDDANEFVITDTEPICSFQIDANWVATPNWKPGVGNWYHFACVWNRTGGTSSGTEYMYVNGKLNYSFGSTGEMDGTPVAAPFTIGYATGRADSQHLNGDVDELVFFNRTLSPGEIRAAYLRGITRLNLSVRSCDDANCVGESFVEKNNVTSPQNFSLNNSRFFQYKFDFNTSDSSYSALLYNTSVSYTLTATDTNPPNVTELLTPPLNSVYNITNTIEIGANATDGTGIVSQLLANISYPNRSTILFVLSNGTGYGSRFNMSFQIPQLPGLYNVSFIANDSSNNKNATQFINFTVRVGCANITTSASLDQDVVSGGSCFHVNASNLVINCSGFTILYGTTQSGFGINNTGGNDNITIKHCRIRAGSISNSLNYGIYFSGSQNNSFLNNTILTTGAKDNVGIVLADRSDTSFLYNNTILANGTGANNFGVAIISTLNTTIKFNRIVANGTRENFGVYITNGSNMSTVENNTIVTYGSAEANYGIYLLTASNNSLIRNIIQTDGKSNANWGIALYQSDNTTIMDNLIITNGSNDDYGILFSLNANHNIVRNNTIISEGGPNSSSLNLQQSANNNLLVNNNLSTRGESPTITDIASTVIDYLIYNNTFGQINWSLANLSTNISLDIGTTVFLQNNTVGLINNPQMQNLNGTARIELRGIPNVTVNHTDMVLLKAGVRCDGTLACNISYDNTRGILSANVSSFSNYSSNQPPTIPFLLLPNNGSSTTNRTPPFSWRNVTDPEGDIISYHLQVDDSSTFNNPEINISAIAATAGSSTAFFFPTTVLAVDTTFYWRVRANDSQGFGQFSNASKFTVDSFLSFGLQTSGVFFPFLGVSGEDNTTDGIPAPLRAENTGNIFSNISINASPLWVKKALNTSFFQFKVRANESSSFDALSATNWKNFSKDLHAVVHVVELNWRDASNDFLLDLNISVPPDEPSGTKASNITFTVESSGVG